MKYLRWYCAALAFLCAGAWAGYPRVGDDDLAAGPQHRFATILIAGYLSTYHYKKVPFSDALSAEVLKRYIETLDPNRSYFLEQDLQAFSVHRDRLDEALREGEIGPAFEIFKVFRRRLDERMTYAKTLLRQPFDFGVDEDHVIDRSKAPWPANRAELDELWRKRVKNDVLELRVAGKDPAETTKTLTDRYAGLVQQTYQLNADDVFDIFINAYALSIEPHTAYFSPRSSEDFRIRMSLSLQGIGAVLRSENGYTVVQQVVPGGPADQSGKLHDDDRIVGVGEGRQGEAVDVIGWRLDKVVDLIRGKRGTVVRLRIIPKGSAPEAGATTITLTRDTIKLEDQAAKKSMIEVGRSGSIRKIGVIKLPAFYIDFEARARGDRHYRSTTRDVRQLMGELIRDGAQGIVIDLRGNGGGSLLEANELTGLFIEEGPIVQVRDADGDLDINEDNDPEIAYGGPLAVLVDRQSASASEIFAGAIQDYRRGLIVGEPTFGKGTVQNLIDLDSLGRRRRGNLGQIKATVAQFFRVNGASTQHRGIEPDVTFPTSLQSSDQGERGLEHALPWDRVDPAEYVPAVGVPQRTLFDLRTRHQQRLASSPIFKLLTEQAEHAQQIEERNRVTLAEDKRRAERSAWEGMRAELEKQLRLAFAGGPTSVKDSAVRKDSAARKDSKDEVDLGAPLLHETAEVLLDLIELTKPVTIRHA
ncbi:MAG: carboxy terminal-processing peptidase, partial [Gammaproteobacteria bacterium]